MIIKNGLVFNAEGRFEEKEVYVEDEKISKTGEGEIIDATGLYVIPGLTDIHFSCMCRIRFLRWNKGGYFKNG